MTLEERWAALFMLAFAGKLFQRADDPQLYTVRAIRPDGRVQLAAYPPAPQIVDVVVEPNAIEDASPLTKGEFERAEEWAHGWMPTNTSKGTGR